MYRVLIVEDDPQVAQINSDFLEQSGFEIAGVHPVLNILTKYQLTAG